MVEGGIFNGNGAGAGDSVLQNVTIASNEAAVDGGGLVNDGGSVLATASIIAGNAPNDCSGAVISGGYNIDGDASCGLAAAGDLAGVDPLLGPLASNSGPTRTHGLALTSPARDIAPLAVCPVGDQ